MLGTDVVVREFPSLDLGSHDGVARLVGEQLEHAPYLRPCFWCTACLLTPRADAISCHDQPAHRIRPATSESGLASLSRHPTAQLPRQPPTTSRQSPDADRSPGRTLR